MIWKILSSSNVLECLSLKIGSCFFFLATSLLHGHANRSPLNYKYSLCCPQLTASYVCIMLAVKILEMSLSATPALIMLWPAGKNICSSTSLLTRDFILFYFFKLAFVLTAWEKQFQNYPQPWPAQQHPHSYAAALSGERHSATPFLIAPHCGKQLFGLDPPSSPGHFVFQAVCLTACSQSFLWKPVIFGCHCSPARPEPGCACTALPRAPHAFLVLICFTRTVPALPRVEQDQFFLYK